MRSLSKLANRHSIASLACVLICFASVLLIALHNLTYAGLWFDETIEYWYSKMLVGPLPFEASSNMYERINTTFQPPLYNVVMHVWLMVNDSEWWFRFFGVVVALIAAVGLYFTVKRLWSHFAACAAVLFMAFTFQLVFFWQECAEYNVLIAVLFWLLFSFVSLLQNPSPKYIYLFVGLSVLAVYSHYGASFAVASFAIAALIHLIKSKQRKLAIRFVLTGVIAIVLAIVPLYLFFFRVQLAHMSAGSGTTPTVPLSPLYYFYGALEVFRFDFASFVGAQTSKVLFACSGIVVVLALVTRRSRQLWLLVIANAICYTLYYFAVCAGVYAHGEFSRRYVLFFTPLWIVLLFEAIHALLDAAGLRLRRTGDSTPSKGSLAQRIPTCIAVCALLVYCSANWFLGLRFPSTKETVRGCVEAWYANGCSEEPTLVNWVGESGFAYYIRQDDRFAINEERAITYVPKEVKELTDEGRREYLRSIFGDKLPQSFCISNTRNTDDMASIINTCPSLGYTHSEILYQGDGSTLTRFRLEPANNDILG